MSSDHSVGNAVVELICFWKAGDASQALCGERDSRVDVFRAGSGRGRVNDGIQVPCSRVDAFLFLKNDVANQVLGEETRNRLTV